MPILIVILLAALIATFGFWETMQGLLGAVGIVILLVLLVGALLGVAGRMLWRRHVGR